MAYAVGVAVSSGPTVDVTPPSTTTVYTLPVCDTVVGWDATVAADGAHAGQAWQSLVDQGWTNPRSGDTTLLVQPGCA